MIGQEFVVATLTNSLRTGKIAQAYLFAGPRGVGKTSAARILARALNCASGPEAEDCLDSPDGEEITRGASIDVIEIDGASNTSVNDVRSIKDEVLFPPQGSRYKIYIIDEVHMLSNSAFNALLKTIEEPPPYIVFIFATTEVHKVPATIRSRCQQFNFRLVPVEQIVSLLQETCDETGIKAEPQALSWIAREATGSIRDAYTLFDQVASFSDSEITIGKIRDKLGILGMERINSFVELLVRGQSHSAMEAFDDYMSRGVSLEQFVADLSDYFRGLLFLSSGVKKENLIGAHPDEYSQEVQHSLGRAQIERLLELLLQVYRNMRYSLNPRLDMEIWISKALAIRDYLPLNEVLSRLRQFKTAGSGSESSGSMTSTAGTGTAQTLPSPGPEARADHANDRSEKPLPTGRADAPKGSEMAESAVQSTNTDTSPDLPSGRAESSQGVDPQAPAINIDFISQKHIDEVLAHINRTHISVATALGKAQGWELEGNQIRISFDTAMRARLVSENLSIVNQAVQEALAPGLYVKIHIDKTAPKTSEDLVDPSAQLVQSIFKGNIIGEAEA